MFKFKQLVPRSHARACELAPGPSPWLSVAKVSFVQVFTQLTGRLLSTMSPKAASEVLPRRFNWLTMHFSDLYYLVDVG